MIHRLQKRARPRFTIIDNEAIEDARLSLEALGLLAYLLSKPDDWNVVVEQLIASRPNGRRAVRAALAELEKFGYIVRKGQKKVAGSRFGHVDMDVYERPPKEETPGGTDDRNRSTERPGTIEETPGGTDDRLPSTVSGPLPKTDLPKTEKSRRVTIESRVSVAADPLSVAPPSSMSQNLKDEIAKLANGYRVSERAPF